MAIIAICRGTKRFGTEVAECLARGLDYPILHEEIMREAAEKVGVSIHDLEKTMSDRPALWEPFSSMRRTYLMALQAALAERAAEGHLVYHGITGGLLLREAPATLTLRCVAPMDMRIRAVMHESDMDAPTAERYIRDLDEARRRWVRVLYDKDVTDPALYDLVVNLANLTVDAACGMVAAMIRQPEYEITDTVRAGLDDFRIASQIRLALAQDEKLSALDLKVAVEDGRVVVSGEAPVRSSGKMGDRIAARVRTVEGVEEVHLNVDWFDPYP